MSNQVANTNNSDGGKSFVDAAKEAVKDEIICKPNCKLCNSEYRAEAEAKYATKNNAHLAYKFLISKNEDISYNAVSNHFKMHYEKQRTNLLVREYLDDLCKHRQGEADKRKDLLDRKNILHKEMVEIASLNNDGASPKERRENAESVKRLSDGIIKIEEKINEIDQEMEPVVVVIKSMKKIISNKLKEIEDEEVSSLLVSILNEWHEDVQKILYEE